MLSELWFLICIALFFAAVQACLSRASPRDTDEAAMLPFADDPEVAQRMERATGKSRTGCKCPGTCKGACDYQQDLTA